MKHQFLKSVIFAVWFLYGTAVWAQDEALDRLKQNINSAIREGDCERVQRNYNAWKDIARKTDSSIEETIRDCYLHNINEAIDNGKCEEAQRDYNALKKFVGRTYSSSVIEGKIRNCRAGTTPPPYNPPHQSTTPPIHLVLGSGKAIYANGEKLRRNEVQQVLKGNALQQYDRGLKKNRNGNIWLISGVCLSAGGGLIVAIHPFEQQDFYIGGDGNEYYRYRNDFFNDALGIGLAAAGAGLIVTGVIMKTKSKNFVRNAVNEHNGGRSRSSVELEFDFTGNSVRLAVKF